MRSVAQVEQIELAPAALPNSLQRLAALESRLNPLRARAYDGFNALIDAAKASGDLHSDRISEDLVLLMMANAGILDRVGTAATAAVEGFVALALAASEPKAPPPRPPLCDTRPPAPSRNARSSHSSAATTPTRTSRASSSSSTERSI